MARQPEVRYINYYVSGTAAYQPERKTRRKPTARLPKAQKQQKLYITVDPMAICGILMATVLLVTLLVGAVQLNQAQQEAQQLQDYVHSLQEENAQLQNTYSSGYDPEEIRDIATAMGMVPADQVTHMQVQVALPQIPREPTAWESFWAFVVGMFA